MAKVYVLEKSEFDVTDMEVYHDTLAVLTEKGKKKFLESVGTSQERLGNITFTAFEVDSVNISFAPVGFILPVRAIDKFVAIAFASILMDDSGSCKTLDEAKALVQQKMDDMVSSLDETPIYESRHLLRRFGDDFIDCKDFSLEGIMNHIASRSGANTAMIAQFV